MTAHSPQNDQPVIHGPLEFELQLASGDAITGPHDIRYLRELLYTGRLTGKEGVRVPGETELVPIEDVPLFAPVLSLRPEKANANRKAGQPFTRWRRDASAHRPQSESDEQDLDVTKAKPKTKMPMKAIAILSGTIVLVTLVTWWMLSSQ